MRTLYEVKKGLVLVAAIVASIGLFACGGGGGGAADDSTTDIIGTAPSSNCSIIAFQVGSESKAVINETVTPATITVTAPYGVNKSSAVATFTLGSASATVKIGDAAQVSGTTSNDFSSAVTYKVTAADGTTTREYSVTLNVLPENKLMITEYVEGSSFNKYLEITNTGSDPVDLSGYSLANLVHTGNPPAAKTPAEATLSGTLAPGKSLVLVNVDYSASTLSVLASREIWNGSNTDSAKLVGRDTAGSVKTAATAGVSSIAVQYFNDISVPIAVNDTFKIKDDATTYTVTSTTWSASAGTTVINFSPVLAANAAVGKTVTVTYAAEDNAAGIICNFNGDDPIVLKQSGLVVDKIGPDSVSAMFAENVIMYRKPGETPSKTYDATKWSIFPISTSASGDDYNAGSYVSSATGNVLKFFSINNVKASISGTNVTLSLPAGTVVTALVPYFHSDAATVSVGATVQTSGSSAVDFSTTSTPQASPAGTNYTKTYTVATGGATQDYTVTIFVPTPQAYTSTNYDFDGKLADVRTAIGTSTDDVTFASPIAIEGVITLIKNPNTIYVQDSNVGLCIYTSNIKTANGCNLQLGDRITLTVTKGKLYSKLPEVTACTTSTLAVVSSGNALYWQPAPALGWATIENVCLYKYTGTITTRAQTGSFDGESTTKVFRCVSSDISFLPEVGVTKTFYGVIDIYNDAKQFTLNSADQIRD